MKNVSCRSVFISRRKVILFFHTDGVTETKRSDGERFGNARLISALNGDKDIGDESLILRVKAAMNHFAGEESQFDDMTMVSVTYLGTGKTSEAT